MSRHFKIESFGKSDVGLLRTNNEDAFRELPKEKFFILADGLGGHNAGEVASSKAVEYMCSAIQNLFLNQTSSLELEELELQMESVIHNTNLWVHHLSISNPNHYGMGTTLCSLLFFQDSVVYSHVGDSRIYRFRRGQLTPLTTDHTKEEPILENPNGVPFSRKVLTQAIGTSIFVAPDMGKDQIEVGDIYLLCSDGLTDLVAEGSIAALLSHSTDLNQVADLLIETAKARGGHDNITLVLARVANLS